MALYLEVLVLGFILSADSFSAAMAMGSRPFQRKDALKFALCSGGAETMATFAGYMAGAHIASIISSVDHWIAFGLLAAVAIHMAMEGIEGLRKRGDKSDQTDFHSFTKVLFVSFATSLDAFGVGVGLGVANKDITPFLFSVGIWAFAATIVGLYLAKSLSSKFGPIFTLLGAAILGMMSVQMLSI